MKTYPHICVAGVQRLVLARPALAWMACAFLLAGCGQAVPGPRAASPASPASPPPIEAHPASTVLVKKTSSASLTLTQPSPLVKKTAGSAEKAVLELAAASQAPLALRISPDGVIRAGEALIMLDFRDGSSTPQMNKGAIEANIPPEVHPGESFLLDAKFLPKTASDALNLNESVERTGDNSVTYSAAVAGTINESASLRLIIRLPETPFAGQSLQVDNQSVELPADSGDFLIGAYSATEVSIPMEKGTLTLHGQWRLQVGDNRFYKQPNFALIFFKPQRQGNSRNIEFEMVWKPHDYQTIRLGPAATMHFADEVSGDRRGGWTDEGKDNDMSRLPLGRQILAGVPFDLGGAEAAGCLALAGPQRDYFPREAQVPVDGAPLRTLYLLHAFAWDHPKGTPLGRIVVTFADDSTQELPVAAHVEATNWTAPYDAPNGRVAWRGDNASRADIGLNLSRFELPGKAVRSVDFQSSGEAVWLVAGLTGSTDAIPADALTRSQPVTMAANEDWQPFTSDKDVEKGSIMDFSFLLDPPAGKHGRVMVRDGRFVFADKPGAPVRFWGTNLVWGSVYLDKPMAERLSKRLARMGYNAVRIHHFDGGLLQDGKRSSYELDAGKLDRLDYLVACLEKEGIYWATDLYCNRSLPPGETDEISGEINTGGVKAAVTVSPSARGAWAQFARRLLSHTNPYTGRTYAEDPGLLTVAPVNENVLELTWSANAKVAQLINQKFDQWLEAQGLAEAADDLRSRAFARYLNELQIASEASLARQLRDEIGLHAPLTDVNHRDYKPLTLVRQHVDVVDVHRYWDHPRFADKPWSLPYLHSGASVLTELAEVPRILFPTRILGKPFLVTEFNYSFPNPHRAESGPIMGAYGAFQNWDGLFRHNHSGSLLEGLDGQAPIVGLNTVNDPVLMMADRIVALLFLRGDVTPAAQDIAFEVDPQTAFSSADAMGSFSTEVSTLGLVTGLGSITAGSAPPAGVSLQAVVTEPGDDSDRSVPLFADGKNLLERVRAAGLFDPALLDTKAGRYETTTRQIVLDAGKGQFAVTTPRTEAFALAESGEVSGVIVRVEVDEPAVVAVSAMDGKDLTQSRKLLILHLTDAQNSGSRFRSAQRRIIETWGEAPVLVRRGGAVLRLKSSFEPGQAALWVVAPSGKRLRELPVHSEGTELVMELNTVTPEGVALAYELAPRND